VSVDPFGGRAAAAASALCPDASITTHAVSKEALEQAAIVSRVNRLERLLGDRSGQWSIRVNDPWRLCFRWTDGDAHEVAIVDYH
jgi:plasmid maintenance system killer protein